MPRTTPARALAASLLACALVTGLAGCGADDGGPRQVGKVLDTTDDDGRHFRQVPGDDAPGVGLIVQPDPRPDGGWDIKVRVRNFRFSPKDAAARPVHGRGYAQLYLDGTRLSRLRAVDYRLPGTRLSRGTHKVTARLYADDGTVWAVEGRPVEATADLTASGAETASPSP
ncbi:MULTISPECIES: hypothetical protein [unclassified Streptomyces]|uniref:hypothetical protein n=1 Tax=unclassified Streptomyces TaxID=2593676 RepID=UPI000DBA48C7|nr:MULTISPECIES: hypothetical protein [unclassified Streptomyces]MYT72855.1 hypothetical protein [Streptomyces sp. SID8367]RAJ78832.1 hypothetical protein K377_05438 [Streptomyces sp. PsTaAH-137]